MAEQQAKDDAARQRIITHMNEDHHDSVVRYLEYYSGQSSWTASGGKMSDIDLNGMSFLCAGKIHKIPFDPPMSSYREARERVVEMDKHCLHGLQRSDITIKEFVPPTGIYALEFLIIAATFLGYSQRWWFAQGEIVERFLGPAFASFSWKVQPLLITVMVGFHSAELLYFAKTRLEKHSVGAGTSLWWKWAATTFVEGMFAFKRFNDLVKKKREEKQKQEH